MFFFNSFTIIFATNRINKMKNLLSMLKISVPEKIFIKDPETSKLYQKILSGEYKIPKSLS